MATWVQTTRHSEWINGQPVYTPDGYVNLDSASKVYARRLTTASGVPLDQWHAVVQAPAGNLDLHGQYASEQAALDAVRLCVGGGPLATVAASAALGDGHG